MLTSVRDYHGIRARAIEAAPCGPCCPLEQGLKSQGEQSRSANHKMRYRYPDDGAAAVEQPAPEQSADEGGQGKSNAQMGVGGGKDDV